MSFGPVSRKHRNRTSMMLACRKLKEARMRPGYQSPCRYPFSLTYHRELFFRQAAVFDYFAGAAKIEMDARSAATITSNTNHQSVAGSNCRDEQHLHGGAGYHGSERLSAAHCRQPLRNYGRSDLGTDLISRGQRDHSANDRLVGELLWPQAPADCVSGRFYGVIVLLWLRSQSAVPHHLSCNPGRMWRR